MSAIELYAKQVNITKGTEHMAALLALRAYLRLTPEADIIMYINTITDSDLLRALIEAGMRGATHKAVFNRLNLLMKEQQGGAP